MPILDSIIKTSGNSLTLVQFPKRWRLANNPELHSFLLDYDMLLDSRQVRCSKCTINIAEEDHLDEYPRGYWVRCAEDGYDGEYYGMQNNTCIKCVRFFCEQCEYEGNEDPNNPVCMLNTCIQCKEEYCDCMPMAGCVGCSNPVCGNAVRNVQTVTLKPVVVVVVKVFLLVILVVRNAVKSVQFLGCVKASVELCNVATVVMIQEESLLSL